MAVSTTRIQATQSSETNVYRVATSNVRPPPQTACVDESPRISSIGIGSLAAAVFLIRDGHMVASVSPSSSGEAGPAAHWTGINNLVVIHDPSDYEAVPTTWCSCGICCADPVARGRERLGS